MEFVSLVLYIIIAAISAAAYYLNKQYTFWRRKKVTHIEAESLYGILYELRKKTGFFELFRNIYHKYKGTGPFVGVYMLSVPSVVALDLDLVRNILIRDFKNFENRGLFYNERDDPLTANIFAADAEKWRPLRAKLSPTFTSGKMKFMFSTVVSVCDRLIEALGSKVKISSDIEVKDLLARFTTDVIGTCAFGIECNSLENPDVEFRKMGKKVLENPRSMGYMLLTEMCPKLARLLRVKRIPPDVTKFFTKIVTETVEYREKNGVRRNDFMDLLIDLKNDASYSTLTMSEIISQSFIFFAAGFETSSTVMGFALYELARNPDMQDKLRREINDVLSRHNGQITYDAIKEMIYLNKVVSECLRLYPTAVHLRRIASNSYPTSDPKYTIPKNAQVIIPVYGIHSDPELYPNPEVFDPERFSPEEIQKRHPMAWIPFGDGPRNCIGLRFGKMQVQIGLAMLIKNFKFSVTEDTPIPMTFNVRKVVLTSEKGIVLKVEKV